MWKVQIQIKRVLLAEPTAKGESAVYCISSRNVRLGCSHGQRAPGTQASLSFHSMRPVLEITDGLAMVCTLGSGDAQERRVG